MGFFKKITQLFSSSPGAENRAYWLHVQCDRCQEKLQVRVDLYNDLSPIYEEAFTTYFCRKVIMGQGPCFQKIEVEMSFDQNRRLVSREIKGGRFINEQEYAHEAG